MPIPAQRISPRDVLRRGRASVNKALTAWSPAALAALAVGLLAAGGTTWVWVAALVAALGALGLVVSAKHRSLRDPRRGGLVASFVSVRLLLLVALGLAWSWRVSGGHGWLWAGVAVALALVAAEPVLKSMIGTPREVVAHLPGVTTVAHQPFGGAWLAFWSLVATVLGGVLVAVGAPGWVLLVMAVLQVPGYLRLVWWALRADARSDLVRASIRPALKAYRPEFVVYYAATSGVRYQLGMWLPYLDRLGRRYVVITRNPSTVKAITGLTSAPVLVPKDLGKAGLEQMVVPSMRAAYYVQGSPANQTFQRYRQLTHIWLNHGDSDKEANFHPRHATYDKLFLSGQLGVERYANHGIEVAPHKFELVGRPQIEAIEPADPDRTTPPSRVLYAPTWQGGRPSTSYSSLQVGPQIVAELLRRGLTVVFRPHPLSRTIANDRRRVLEIVDLLKKDAAATGSPHVWGAQAEITWDVPACFNATDLLITDVSSLASDYLASGKPFAMVAVTRSGEAFRREFATARAAYVIEKDLSTLDESLDAMLGDDPMRAAREEYRRYCLGDHLGAHAADGFVQASLAILDAPAKGKGKDVTEDGDEGA